MQGEAEQIAEIHICYATQTGNAYQLALQTCYALKNKVHGFSELNDQFNFVKNNFYILFVSTTGQGDPPYSMRQFWKKIMNKAYPSLKDIKFCVYGLGDRSYGDNFNMTSRKLRQRLLMLQASEVIGIGLGDDQDSNGCFHQYFSEFYPALFRYLNNRNISSKQILGDAYLQNLKLNKLMLKKQLQIFRITDQKLLSSIQDKDVYQVCLQTEGRTIELGDILEIYPHNNSDTVEDMINYFKENKLVDIQIEDQKLRKYLKETANLDNVLNFTFFFNNPQWVQLGSFMSTSLDEQIKKLFEKKLKQLGQDYDEYFNYIKKYRRNVREVISDFSLKIPLSCLMQRLGTIIPRKYSISKIQTINGDKFRINLLLKLQKYKVSNNRILKGLCSHDLCLTKIQGLEDCHRIGRILKNGEFQCKFDFSENKKIAMISLGTGVAPFLSILDIAARNDNNWQLLMFHSSRYREEIPIKSEIRSQLEKEQKLKLFVTCTRQKNPIENRRLHIIIQENLQLLQQCKEGKIFICGVKEFCEIVCRILEEKRGFDIKKLKKQKIICVENW